MELTLIDPAAPIGQQAQALAQACETDGFFQIPLSVVSADVRNTAWDAATDFFARSEEEKRRIEFPEPGYPYGYSPYRFETLARSLDDQASDPDLKESLSVGPDCGIAARRTPGRNAEEAWIRSPSLWPDSPSNLKQSWIDYYQALSGVAEDLMRVMAVALNVDADFFQPLIDDPITSMRALHYPALDPSQPLGASLRAGAHSDYGTLTILRTDDVAGLEIQTADGRWEPVSPRPDTFVVNLGDSIAQWTNNRWRSTVHRVAVTDTAPRQSFAFFHMANWDATIECLPGCRADGEPARHEPVQAGPWLMKKFQSTVASL